MSSRSPGRAVTTRLRTAGRGSAPVNRTRAQGGSKTFFVTLDGPGRRHVTW
jgi:hypothetical protein